MDFFGDTAKLRQVLKERSKEFKVSHTYLFFKKLDADVNNPLYKYRGLELNTKIEEIVLKNWASAKVIYDFDYGLGGLNNIVFYIPYQDHKLCFAIDLWNLVLINSFVDSDETNLNYMDYSTLFLIDNFQSFVKKIKYLNHNFYAINTYCFCQYYIEPE